MGKKPYRVEVNFPKSGKPQYFLVKDVKVRGKKRKARKYLGIKPLSKEDKEYYRKFYAFEMELKAAEKRASISSTFYNSKNLTKEEVRTIEEIRYVYKTFTDLLTTDEVSMYEQNFEVRYIQGTTSIEGNTISLNEAYSLLVNDVLPAEKSLREINEVQNFKKVKTYRDDYKGKINLDFIKTLHYLIMTNISESAGIFRRIDDVGIVGCDFRLTPSELIESELKEIITTYYERINDDGHPFEEAVKFHHAFETIHPFVDGNGRVGREILNYLLSKIGYPKLLFLGEDRTNYISLLKAGDEEKYAEMVRGFSHILMKQRMSILIENLKKVIVPPKRKGQLRLTEFILPSDNQNKKPKRSS